MQLFGDVLSGIQPPAPPRNPYRGQSYYIRDVAAASTPVTRDERCRLMLKLRAFAVATRSGGKRLVSRSALDVYGALLFHFCNRKDGACFPSLETIAAHIGASKQTVVNALKQLIAHGFLIKTRRLRRTKIVRTSAITGQLEEITTTIQASNVYAFPALAKAGAWVALALSRVQKVGATKPKADSLAENPSLLDRIRGLAMGEEGKPLPSILTRG